MQLSHGADAGEVAVERVTERAGLEHRLGEGHVAGDPLGEALLDVHLGEVVDGGVGGEVGNRSGGAEPSGELRGAEPGGPHDRDVAGLGEERLVAGADRLEVGLGGLQVLLVGGDALAESVALGSLLVELGLGGVQRRELVEVVGAGGVAVLLTDADLLGVLDLEHRPDVGVLLVDLRRPPGDLGLELVDLGFRGDRFLVDLGVGGLVGGEPGLVGAHRGGDDVEAGAGVGELDRRREQLGVGGRRRGGKRGGGGGGGLGRRAGPPGERQRAADRQHQRHREDPASEIGAVVHDAHLVHGLPRVSSLLTALRSPDLTGFGGPRVYADTPRRRP